VRRLFLSVVCVACTKRDVPPPAPVVVPVEAAAAPIVDAAVEAEAAAAPSDDDAYLSAAPRGGRSIGHTSVVFKIELANGKKCAYKPASRRGPRRYRGEVAARRLALLYGLPNVPPAMIRTFRDAELRPVLPEIYANEALVDPKGIVHGALMPWLDKLEFLPLESDLRWKTWLKRDAEIAEDQRAIAADTSTMIAFDFITGNWDRWSGGNVGIDRASNRVLFIDNDGAFFEVVPKDSLVRSRRLLAECDRFSKSFVAAVREKDDAAIAEALGEETQGSPLISEKAFAGVSERRAELLRIWDEKGEAALYFP
jgi:hypothetical protein